MNTLMKILSLIPALIEVIQSIEKLWPEGASGQGKEKLSTVQEILTIGYDGIQELWPYLEKVIAVLVATMNKTGLFKK